MSCLSGIHSLHSVSIRLSLEGADPIACGIGYFSGAGAQIFIEQNLYPGSPVARLLHDCPVKSGNILICSDEQTHLSGAIQNQQPFNRQLWGYNWIFSSSGIADSFCPELSLHFLPIGESVSERVFCYLLEVLKSSFPLAHKANPPRLCDLKAVLTQFAGKLKSAGPVTLFLSNGKFIFAYSVAGLAYKTITSHQLPFSKKIHDGKLDLHCADNVSEKMVLISSSPVADAGWQCLPDEQSVLFVDGECILCQETR